ncbi:hypothetical protein [Synechococcus sp. UW179A]|uniref:hypothetical protein n=1 Tax=Synechococcus sp. UW179A TaxID=2575510 RepID=UPI000E0E3B96|nr:hypothetical protein [Synechococcus sp. UW179A]
MLWICSATGKVYAELEKKLQALMKSKGLQENREAVEIIDITTTTQPSADISKKIIQQWIKPQEQVMKDVSVKGSLKSSPLCFPSLL